VAGIEDEGRTVVSEGNGDVGGLTAPQEACVDEDVEDDEAQLLVQAIEQWRAGAPAMADRRRARTRWGLGFGFAVDTEREREGIRGREGEELVGHLIQARGGSGGTELRARGGGSTAAVATARGRGRLGCFCSEPPANFSDFRN
jgi:hypothetical protein